MWIYTPDLNNTVRYTLGEPGKNNLICIGINPSTAEPDKLDPTLTVVKKLSQKHDFDGWVMLNVYPQRATNPSNLHKQMDEDLHKKNLIYIKNLIYDYPQSTIWAAWGTIIEKRKYLKDCLKDISSILVDLPWISIGSVSKSGHPHHPLYLKYDSPVWNFDIMRYINI